MSAAILIDTFFGSMRLMPEWDKSRWFPSSLSSYNVNKIYSRLYKDATESVLCVDALHTEWTFSRKFWQLENMFQTSWILAIFSLSLLSFWWNWKPFECSIELVSLVARATDNELFHEYSPHRRYMCIVHGARMHIYDEINRGQEQCVCCERNVALLSDI